MAARKKTSKKASKPETEPPIPATKRPASARRSRAGGSTEKRSSSAAGGGEGAGGASGLPTGKAAIDRKPPARASVETAEAGLKVKALKPSADKPAAVA